MRRTPLKRGTKRLKRTAMRRRSKKLSLEMINYNIEKALYLRAHPTCECHDVVQEAQGFAVWRRPPSQDVHHMKRRGKMLRVQEWWKACCRECHDYIEANKKWARSVGLILYK